MIYYRCKIVKITNFLASFPLVNLVGCLANTAAAFLRKQCILIHDIQNVFIIMALHLILILTKILKTMHVCKTYNTKREK